MKIPSELHKLKDTASPGVLLDQKNRQLVASNGIAMAIIPITSERLAIPSEVGSKPVWIPDSENEITPDTKTHQVTEDHYWGNEDITKLVKNPAVKMTVNAQSLAMLAAAVGEGDVTLHVPQQDPECEALAIHVTTENSKGYGYIISQVENVSGFQTPSQPAAQPAPRRTTNEPSRYPLAVTITYNEKHNGLELAFQDVPGKDIRESLKLQGFRWHRGKGIWYGKATEARIQFASNLASKAGAEMPAIPTTENNA